MYKIDGSLYKNGISSEKSVLDNANKNLDLINDWLDLDWDTEAVHTGSFKKVCDGIINIDDVSFKYSIKNHRLHSSFDLINKSINNWNDKDVMNFNEKKYQIQDIDALRELTIATCYNILKKITRKELTALFDEIFEREKNITHLVLRTQEKDIFLQQDWDKFLFNWIDWDELKSRLANLPLNQNSVIIPMRNNMEFFRLRIVLNNGVSCLLKKQSSLITMKIQVINVEKLIQNFALN